MNERYFIAIRLPSDISGKIMSVQDKNLDGYPVMKPFQPHITIVPPNVLDNLPPESITDKFKSAAEKYFPLGIELVNTNVFEKRVLHIKAHCPKLDSLQNELMNLLPSPNRAKSNRDFIAHVTLAQAKPKQELPDKLTDRLNLQIKPLLPYKFRATSLSKFKWLRPRTYEDNVI